MSRDLFKSIDQEYHQEVEALRAEFAALDVSNLETLRVWFGEHPYLTTNDRCRIAGVSLKTVQRWRRLLGLPASKRIPPQRWQFPRLLPTAPADWRAGSWLQEQYPRFSIHEIARMIGRSYSTTRQALRLRGVKFRSSAEAVRSKHPCCRKDWLERYYLEAGLSLSGCARLARVSSSTMTDWLLRFEIRIRSVAEQQALNAWRKRKHHYPFE